MRIKYVQPDTSPIVIAHDDENAIERDIRWAARTSEGNTTHLFSACGAQTDLFPIRTLQHIAQLEHQQQGASLFVSDKLITLMHKLFKCQWIRCYTNIPYFLHIRNHILIVIIYSQCVLEDRSDSTK